MRGVEGAGVDEGCGCRRKGVVDEWWGVDRSWRLLRAVCKKT